MARPHRRAHASPPTKEVPGRLLAACIALQLLLNLIEPGRFGDDSRALLFFLVRSLAPADHWYQDNFFRERLAVCVSVGSTAVVDNNTNNDNNDNEQQAPSLPWEELFYHSSSILANWLRVLSTCPPKIAVDDIRSNFSGRV